jgi:hypothetical protein
VSPRTRWLAGGAAVLATAVGVVAWILLAQSGTTGKPGVVARPGSTTTTRNGTVPSSSAGSPVTIGIICTSPTDAAQSFVNAWIAGDRGAAARCASSAAVDKLFRTGGAGAQWSFQGCSTTGGAATCQYSYQGGAANLATSGSTAAGWKVTAVSFVAD